MVFEHTGGLWKLATGCHLSRRPGLAGPVHQRSAPYAPRAGARQLHPDLDRVLISAATGPRRRLRRHHRSRSTTPIGPGLGPARVAEYGPDRRSGITFTGRFSAGPDPTFVLRWRPATTTG
jgi:hypothetical protein